ncbi:MAG: glucose-1-phosphate cytidylyltransferase [Gammaproteobacteria bacterium]|jgi:glucose-1-phosphate cytidylyltransferase
MKVVILAGGLGTRLMEETEARPKPMVEIGGHPILWHIMKIYAHHGFQDFCVALGYKGDAIKRYFAEYSLLGGAMTVDLGRRSVEYHNPAKDAWKIDLIATGLLTPTGSRVKRLEPWIGSDPFLLTYGDGVADIDVRKLLEFHRRHGRLATVTAVRPPARFGGIVFDGDLVRDFTEKPQIGEGWINGGFMVLEPGVFDYLSTDDTVLESDALEKLAAHGQLAAYKHEGYWQCMDTLRDLRTLSGLWDGGAPPWRVW